MFEESSCGQNEGNNISFSEEQEDDCVQDEELFQVEDQVEAEDDCCATLIPEDDGVQDEEIFQVQDQVEAQVPEDDDVPGCSYSAKLAEDVQESEEEDQDSECTMY